MKSSIPEIRQLCDINDVVFLQETWLSSDELHLLASLDDRFYGQGVSAMVWQQTIARASSWWLRYFMEKDTGWMQDHKPSKSSNYVNAYR